MLYNDRITILMLLVFSIARVHESRADQQDVNINVNINDEESGQVAHDDSLEHWQGRWMPSRPGEYTAPSKIFHKQKNEMVPLPRKDEQDSLEHWKGRWMPSRPGEYTPPAKIFQKSNKTSSGQRYINTGINDVCDDGLSNLDVDWDGSSTRSCVCFGKKIIPDLSLVAEYYCETIPNNYQAMHQCMSKTIEYVQDVPTFGTSRPVWPAYGEYEYVPVQRWLRSLERGAIVMLYHPCANTLEVEGLKRSIKRCLTRHIISPSNYLDEARPLALLAWGCKLSMSYVDGDAVKQFLSENAWRVAEEDLEEGVYVEGLLEKAKLVAGDHDGHLCP